MSVLTVVRVAIHDVIIRIVFFLDYAIGAEKKLISRTRTARMILQIVRTDLPVMPEHVALQESGDAHDLFSVQR